MPLKSNQVLGAFSGVLLLLSPWVSDLGKLPRLGLSLTGLALLVTVPGSGSREEDDDIWAYFKAGGSRLFKGVTEDVRKVVHDYGPPELQSAVEGILSSAGESGDHKQLFREALNKSFLIIAETDGGKTWIEHQALKVDIEAGRKVMLMDNSIGKRTTEDDLKTGLGFWWFAPIGEVVFKFDEENPVLLADLLKTFYEERKRRKALTEAAAERHQAAPKFQQWRLTLAELNLSIAAYVQAQKVNSALPAPEQIDFWLSKLLFDGHGYGMLVGGDAQTAAVGRTGIDESQRSQINWFLMGSAAVNQTELVKFGLKASEWKPKVSAMRKIPGYERTGILILKGAPYLWVPQAFDEIELEFRRQGKEDVDRVQTWIEENRQAVRDWVNAQDNEPTNTQAYEAFKANFPTGFKNRAADNPYWEALKTLLEESKTTGVS